MIGAIDLSDSQTSALASQAEKPQKKNKARRLIIRTIMVILSAVVMVVGLALFLVPNHIMDSGIITVSNITSHLLSLPLGIFIFVLNLPVIFLGYKQLGKTHALSIGIGITILSVATILLHNLDPYTKDILLATVFGGMILGIGVSIVRSDGTIDNTAILVNLYNEKLALSVGKVITIFNLCMVVGFVKHTMFSVTQRFKSKIIEGRIFLRSLYVDNQYLVLTKKSGVNYGK